jgi:hypothetical protein
MEKESVKTTKLIFLVLELAPPSSSTRYLGKASTCHSERRKNEREGKEVAIVDVLAGKKVDGGGGQRHQGRVVIFAILVLKANVPKAFCYWRSLPGIGMVLVEKKERYHRKRANVFQGNCNKVHFS